MGILRQSRATQLHKDLSKTKNLYEFAPTNFFFWNEQGWRKQVNYITMMHGQSWRTGRPIWVCSRGGRQTSWERSSSKKVAPAVVLVVDWRNTAHRWSLLFNLKQWGSKYVFFIQIQRIIIHTNDKSYEQKKSINYFSIILIRKEVPTLAIKLYNNIIIYAHKTISITLF